MFVCCVVAGYVTRSHASVVVDVFRFACAVFLCFFSCQEPSRYICANKMIKSVRLCHHQTQINKYTHIQTLTAYRPYTLHGCLCMYTRHCHTTKFIFDMFRIFVRQTHKNWLTVGRPLSRLAKIYLDRH